MPAVLSSAACLLGFVTINSVVTIEPDDMRSAFRLQVLPARYVLFTTMFADSAIGTTLAALQNRMAVAPSTKFAPELRDGLPRSLRGLLEWELPMAKDLQTGATEHGVTAKL